MRATPKAPSTASPNCAAGDYDASLLEVLPEEIIERDYGCGDPSRFVREGEVVLDLGSGVGRSATWRARSSGPKGRVIGVDTTTEEMLELCQRKLAGPELANADRLEEHRVSSAASSRTWRSTGTSLAAFVAKIIR